MNSAAVVPQKSSNPFVQWALVAAVALGLACGEGALEEGQGAQGVAPFEAASSGVSDTQVAEEGVEAELAPLMAAARAFFEARNRQLIDGEGAVPPPAQGLLEPLSERAERDHAALRILRDRLALMGERYVGFQTELRLIQARQSEGKILALIEERTRLDYAKVRGDEPPSTSFRVERELTFEKRQGRWLLAQAQLREQGGLAPINEVVTVPASPDPPPSSLLRHPSQLDPSRQPLQGLGDVTANYNHSAMVKYATDWALGRNPSYRSFANDCTNFISQAVLAGGWGMVSGWYQSNSAWWYSSFNQTWTWAGAHNWYWFATGSGRTTLLSNVWYTALADVLQMDFERDGNINHTMMVTYLTSNERYLSYHSTDTLNRSLSSIIAAYPSAWYYAHRI